MYESHPSSELNTQFRQRPYQGVEPSLATFLFVGLDANYEANLEGSPSFQSVLEYHEDGVAFWRRHGVHHPFCLPEYPYRGDGRRYHQNFANIGFKSKHADLVSFVELLHVPTVGRNRKLAPNDLDSAHLQKLNAAILHGKAKHVFVSAKVADLMRASKAFPWLPKTPKTAPASGLLRVFYGELSRSVYSHLHFSNYGKFQQQLEEETRAIATLIPADA